MPKTPDLPTHLNQQVKPYANVDVVRLPESAMIPDACKHMVKANTDEIIVTDKNELLTALILVVAFPIIPLFVANHMHGMGYDFEDSYFDAVSALTTTGLGTGTVTSSLDSFTITVFAFLMILGRIEIILLLYMFVPKLIP